MRAEASGILQPISTTKTFQKKNTSLGPLKALALDQIFLDSPSESFQAWEFYAISYLCERECEDELPIKSAKPAVVKRTTVNTRPSAFLGII